MTNIPPYRYARSVPALDVEDQVCEHEYCIDQDKHPDMLFMYCVKCPIFKYFSKQ